jgi:hypothetical protein
MSSYSLYEAAPVVNYGYFDVPINNDCSNRDIRDAQQTLNEYNFNSKINNTMNNNKQKYMVNQQPTVPSTSLYIESNNPAAGYYKSNNPVLENPQANKKKQLRENFTGSSAIDDYSHLYIDDSNSVSYTPSNSYGDYYATHEMKPNYLNEQTIPNISSVYLNSPVSEPSNTGRKSEYKKDNQYQQNQQNQQIQQNNMMGNSYQMQMKAAQDYAKNAQADAARIDAAQADAQKIALRNVQKLAKNIQKNKMIEIDEKRINKKKVFKKKVDNCQKNTLTGSVFILSFVVLILALLIFFKHFK